MLSEAAADSLEVTHALQRLRGPLLSWARLKADKARGNRQVLHRGVSNAPTVSTASTAASTTVCPASATATATASSASPDPTEA
mmetsp:Transcript_20013/g.45097  ORF Transcript_20013/g.45097 Transcript_20013/m.45097 type:complete len:84 (-) Transcript_20013:412-663(-)